MTDNRYKIISSLYDKKHWIEDNETGGLTEPFNLEDLDIDRIGMFGDLRIVYNLTIALKNVEKGKDTEL